MYFVSFAACGNHHDHKLSSETSSPDAEITLRDELSSNGAAAIKKPFKTRKEGIMSKSMQMGGQVASTMMSNSLPSYDLQRLFKAPEILQVNLN